MEEEPRGQSPVSPYGQQERILPATRTLPIWTDVEVNWDTAHETADLLLNLIAQLHKSISELGRTMSETMEDVLATWPTFTAACPKSRPT